MLHTFKYQTDTVRELYCKHMISRTKLNRIMQLMKKTKTQGRFQNREGMRIDLVFGNSVHRIVHENGSHDMSMEEEHNSDTRVRTTNMKTGEPSNRPFNE